MTDSPTFFSWVIEKKLAASGLPSSRGQILWLKQSGIDTILSLTEDPLPASWLEGSGVTAKHISMIDHAPADPEKLREAADYIAARLKEGRVVLVHCLAGKGRTGSALAAYMIAYEGKGATEAIEHLRQLRPGSVELPQRASVYEFERRLNEGARP